jgi:DNA-binding NarL/FixJ family response regulator
MKKTPTKRKLEVLALLARAKTDEEIAVILDLSQHTAKNIVSLLREDYKVASRIGVVMTALARGDLEVEETLACWR